MKKILVSVAAATIALSTTASALEDIKVNGQAKLWYETDNGKAGPNGAGNIHKAGKKNSLFDRDSASGEVVFKLGMTGKQGDVGFGATLYHANTMGLENNVVGKVRTNSGVNDVFSGNGDTFFGELYFTAPIAPDTTLKFGKQELDTPLAFTERWNAMPNTFNAAVAINNSVDNLTLIGAYIGQGNANQAQAGLTAPFASGEEFSSFYGTAYAVAALYKQDNISTNLWAYRINKINSNVINNQVTGLPVNAHAVWFDAGMKVDDMNFKGYLAYAATDKKLAKKKETMAAAISADITVEGVKLFGAVSHVTKDGALAIANTATGFKKTMLPTQGIYTDGQYVAQPGSTAAKLSAATKLGDTGVSLNVAHNSNDNKKSNPAYKSLDTTEVYATVSQKVGAFDLMGIVMHRHMNDSATDKAVGGEYVRVVASVNF